MPLFQLAESEDTTLNNPYFVSKQLSFGKGD